MTQKSDPLRVVHIISGDRWAGAEVQAYTLLCELKNQVSLHAIILNEGELSARLRKKGIAVTIIDETQYGSLAILNTLIDKLRKIKPSIVHTHRQKENILGSLANLLSSRAKCLRTVHGGPEFIAKGKQKAQEWINKLCGRYLQQAIIAVSDDLSKQLSDIYPPKKIHTIVNGIDPHEVCQGLTTPTFKNKHPAATIHIGIVGRIEPVKRVDIFLTMAELLLKNHAEIPWFFHVFGDGSLLDSMHNQAQTLGINKYVEFHGHKEDIRSCIAALDTVVMPSDHEGLPMTALESLALGTPMIAHDVGGLSDLLNATPPNALIANHTPNAYAEALVALTVGNDNKKNIPVFPSRYLSRENRQQIEALYTTLLS